MIKIESCKHFVVCAAIYFLLAIILTYPLIVSFASSISYSNGDPVGNASILYWNYHNIFLEPGNNIFDINIFYPQTQSALNDILVGHQIFFAPVFYFTGNPILATNVLILFSYFLSALFMFLFAFHISKNYSISFIAGLFYGFSPLKEAFTFHIHMIYWIPLFFLFFDKFLKEKKAKFFIFAAIVYCLQMLSSWYIGYMLSLAILCYTVICFLKERKTIDLKKMAFKAVPGIALILIVVGPFAYYYNTITSQGGMKKSLGENLQYSASLDDYFRAPDNNMLMGGFQSEKPFFGELPLERRVFEMALPLLGEQARNLGADKLPGDTIKEKLPFERFSSIINSTGGNPLYLGFVLITCMILGIFYFSESMNPGIAVYKKPFLWILIVFLILSFGPFLTLFGHFLYLPLPYLLMYYILPAFDVMRVPARFGIIVLFAASILSIGGIYYLFDRFKVHPIKKWITPIIVCLVIMEYLAFPFPMHLIQTGDNVPEVYHWLKDQEINGGVAEVPARKGDGTKYDPVYGERRHEFTQREVKYFYYTTYHNKPIINGYSTFFPETYREITSCINTILDPASQETLKSYNVNIFIVHLDLLDETDMPNWTPESIEQAGLKVIKDFGNEVILGWI